MNNSETVVDHTEATKLFGSTEPDQVEDQDTDAQEKELSSDHPAETPIYLGGKKFSSVSELAKYTESLELERQVAANKSQDPQQPQVVGKKVSDLLFEDPEKALQLHEQQIIERMRAEEHSRNSEKQWWDSFYSKNKDLSEDRDVVQFTVNNYWNELKSMHPEQAAEKLADYTRKTLVRFRKAESKKEEMPSGQARAASGTSLSAPRIQESKPAPVDFVTQLKKIQSKRK